MAEKLVADLIAPASITHISGDDFAKKIWAASIVAAFRYSLVRILVKIPVLIAYCKRAGMLKDCNFSFT